MCAIIGVLGNRLPNQEQFIKARDVMIHRGPDGAGVYYSTKEGVALGHRRLSIIDLSSAGKQPFVSNDGRFILVYNGEIYNYIELKKELASQYHFKTKTDTEVLLAAYIVWGEACLQKLNGMFAFAIWDKEKETLFCARDRLGMKPFFYAFFGGTFFFASEIKALLALNVKAVPNEKIIFDYLYYGLYDHTEDTFFTGIKNLSAGSFLVVHRGKIVLSKYWDLRNFNEESRIMKEQEVKEKFLELLTDAIRIHHRSDVSVGLGLSSGLDSNTLLYFSKEVTGHTMHMFSECFTSEEFNECSRIQEYLHDSQKTLWHRKILEPEELFRFMPSVNEMQDQPFGGIPTIANTMRFKEAHLAGVKVLFEGEGLDDILGGYKYYRPHYEKDIGSQMTGPQNFSKDAALDYSQDLTKVIYQNLLNQKFVLKYSQTVLPWDNPFKSALLNAQYRDITHTKLPRVLRFKDHASMAYGRELRIPYLDYRLVEFCFFLPSQYKINDKEQKVLLRKLMEPYVPDVVRIAQKKTFGVVQVEWFRKYYRDKIDAMLHSSSFRERGYWDYRKLDQQIDAFNRGEGDNSFFIWQCINLELWFRKFID